MLNITISLIKVIFNLLPKLNSTVEKGKENCYFYSKYIVHNVYKQYSTLDQRVNQSSAKQRFRLQFSKTDKLWFLPKMPLLANQTLLGLFFHKHNKPQLDILKTHL